MCRRGRRISFFQLLPILWGRIRLRWICSLVMGIALGLIGASERSTAAESCQDIFATIEKALTTEKRSAKMKGGRTDFTFVRGKAAYHIEKELPALKDSFLIHMNRLGHVMLWYRGMRIDSQGTPFAGIFNDMTTAPALWPGVLLEVRNLPPGFEAKFKGFADTFKSEMALTCVSSACGSLRQLGFKDEAPRKFLSATGFFHHLLEQARTSPDKYRLWVLGENLDGFPKHLKSTQARVMAIHFLSLSMLGLMPASYSTQRLTN